MQSHILHSHSRASLIDAGDLVEVPWVVSNSTGLGRPVALSRAAWHAVMDGLDVERWPDMPGLVTETLLVERATRTLRAAVQSVREFHANGDRGDCASFHVPLYGLSLHLHIGPGDDGEPVLTVFMPGEI
ncbi:hypothetical protein ACWCQP_49140 [Streptomyces chartreusis]